MSGHLHFSSSQAFRQWLETMATSDEGVWLLFGKSGGPNTLTANEALEEALCFGWIDGQMKRLDDTSYVKYFSQRRPNSKWSEKNKVLAQRLEAQNRMTSHGRAKIEEAKKNGQWEKVNTLTVTEDDLGVLVRLLQEYEPAYTNFQAMSPSVQKTYARAYYDAKTDAARQRRIAWMVDRLNQNLKPM